MTWHPDRVGVGVSPLTVAQRRIGAAAGGGGPILPLDAVATFATETQYGRPGWPNVAGANPQSGTPSPPALLLFSSQTKTLYVRTAACFHLTRCTWVHA